MTKVPISQVENLKVFDYPGSVEEIVLYNDRKCTISSSREMHIGEPK